MSPMRNAVGDVRGLQIINEQGNARFLMGMEKEGNFHLITGPDQDKAGLYSISRTTGSTPSWGTTPKAIGRLR